MSLPRSNMMVPKLATEVVQYFESLHDGDTRTKDLFEPVRDPVGIWTIGWGSIFDLNGKAVTQRTPALTRAQADELLVKTLAEKLEDIIRLLFGHHTKLEVHQIAALVVFIYNVGEGNFGISQLRKNIINSRPVVEWNFKSWRRAGGAVIPGLVIRRKAEFELWSGEPWDIVRRRVEARQRLSRRGLPYDVEVQV